MKNNKVSYLYNKIDTFFPWLLVITFIFTITLLFYHFNFHNDINGISRWDTWSFENTVSCVLIAWALFSITMQIWFACHYKPYDPVSDKDLPIVTIIIPAYNEGSQVLSTVRSVMNSNYPAEKMQIVCVDDGSKDDTWTWMRQAKKEFPHRIKLIRQPFNCGKRHALREGFTNAKGSIFVTIDSDSEIMPDTLRHLVSPFVADKRVGGVAGNVRVLNLDEGIIPKMLEVAFTYSFDFIRSGQSVYGGVFCTPGALSAYRAEVIKPYLTDWINQTFMGKQANIGEDRALTNLILSLGYRVVYQRKAMVKTKIPVAYNGLRKMLLRWARSNVRENLVMFSFVTRRFRPSDSGSGWIRLFSATQLFRLTLGEGFKFALIAQLMLDPADTLIYITFGCMFAALLPSIVYQKHYGTWFGWQWALPFSFFWLFGLSWIAVWGLITASRSGWLTRQTVTAPDPQKLLGTHQQATRRVFSKAA